MKAYLIQPPYSMNYSDIDACFNELLKLLDLCDDSADVIVLPEYSDVLSATPSGKDFILAIEKYGPIIEKKVKETAVRCGATIFANFAYKTENGYRNTTHVFDKTGKVVGRYFKHHPAPSELKNPQIDTDYANELTDFYTLDLEGVRYGFRTCYDFYFYEDTVGMARKNLDVIIGCSYQRTDTHEALEIMTRHLAYNTNAYVLRSSISLGKNSKVCGCTMAVAPDGTILQNLKNQVAILKVDIDPKAKYYKPSGFNGLPKSHYEYVDEGRKK